MCFIKHIFSRLFFLNYAKLFLCVFRKNKDFVFRHHIFINFSKAF